MNDLDLNLLSLYRVNGQEWPLLPGLLAQNPPKKTARGRENDRLIIYLTLTGNATFSSAEYAQVTSRLAERFYQTAGSLTFALKTSVEALNSALAERNMKTTGQGQYAIGLLVLAALRGNALYIVQAGTTRACHLGQGLAKQYYDVNLAGKGLGLSQNSRMYFAQASLAPGDQVLLCAVMPKEWEPALETQSTGSLEVTRRRLLGVTTASLNAVLIGVSAGQGLINVLRVSKDSAATEAAPEPVSAPQPPVASPPALSVPADSTVTGGEPDLPVLTPAPAIPAPKSQPHPRQIRPAPGAQLLLTPERREKLDAWTRTSARWLAKSIRAGRESFQKTGQVLAKFLPRLLPGSDAEFKVPPYILAFIAVAIPLLVVTVAVVVYMEFGSTAEYETYYAHAVESAMQAVNTQDPATLRLHWEATLYWLNEAEKYSLTEDSRHLRRETQARLDSLDRVVRVDFKPAFNLPLSKNLAITQMAASDTDLYMLDSQKGSVLRGVLMGSSYNLVDFSCGNGSGYQNIDPGITETVDVKALVDIIALPRSMPYGITLMGIDSGGSLAYCIPGENPRAAKLKLPATGPYDVTAMAYDANNLYVLDAKKNAIWVYFGLPNAQFPNEPIFFFEQQVPNLQDAIELAVNGDDIFILHNDGHLTTCTLSRITPAPTRCNDPATLIDTRPGFRSGPILGDGQFSRIIFTSPPDPSIALLQPGTNSIFRFSARALELQNQIRALPGKENPLPEGSQITAMAFSPNKILFIAIASQVFFAANIP
jgi:hypothetical protein